MQRVKTSIYDHQRQRRNLWLDIATHPEGGHRLACEALAAFDIAFPDPDKGTTVDINITGDINMAGSITPVSDPLPEGVVELVLRGAPGSGKTTLMRQIVDYLPSVFNGKGRDPVKVVFATPGCTNEYINELSARHSRILLIRDEQE